MMFRKIILSLISLLIIFLLAESFLSFDFAVSKNNALTNIQKYEIDEITNIDSVKTKAKDSLNIIRKNQQSDSKRAVRRFWVLIALSTGITFILFTKNTNKYASN